MPASVLGSVQMWKLEISNLFSSLQYMQGLSGSVKSDSAKFIVWLVEVWKPGSINSQNVDVEIMIETWQFKFRGQVRSMKIWQCRNTENWLAILKPFLMKTPLWIDQVHDGTEIWLFLFEIKEKNN